MLDTVMEDGGDVEGEHDLALGIMKRHFNASILEVLRQCRETLRDLINHVVRYSAIAVAYASQTVVLFFTVSLAVCLCLVADTVGDSVVIRRLPT